MSKLKVENCPSIDVLEWNRQGYLQSGFRFERTWSHDGEPVKRLICDTSPNCVVLHSDQDSRSGSDIQRQGIRIVWTPCRFGGERPWMLCPHVLSGRLCGRRVTKLFCLDFLFACRHCHRLGYASQYQPADERKARKAREIRRRLAPGGDTPDAFPQKPGGMHWRTYRRFLQIHAEAEDAAAEGLLRIIASSMTAR